MSYQYFGQKVLFDNMQILLATGSNTNIEAYIPFTLTAVSADGSGHVNVPVWKCKTLLDINHTGSTLQLVQISKVTFEIGHIDLSGNFSGSALGAAYPDFIVTGSPTNPTGSKVSILALARPTGSSMDFDLGKLACRIRVIGGTSGDPTPATLTLHHTRGNPETWIKPIFYASL